MPRADRRPRPPPALVPLTRGLVGVHAQIQLAPVASDDERRMGVYELHDGGTDRGCQHRQDAHLVAADVNESVEGLVTRSNLGSAAALHAGLRQATGLDPEVRPQGPV